MKKLLLLAVACVVYYVAARAGFSENRVTTWLASHSARSMSGDSAVCDDYADDLEVSLTAEGQRGHWEVEGGKEEMCGYIRQASAAFALLQARTQTRLSDVRVVRAGFPWTHATVTYTQQTTVHASRIPSITMESRDTVVLVRTMSGTKIRSIESHGTGGL